MIFFDTTKSGKAGHRSGLVRVGTQLAQELGPAATRVSWPLPSGVAKPDDWFITGELFSEAERPGLTSWLESRPCRAAAIFHDAIPLKQPHLTWPHSVARHPGYMKLLARFDRVWAVSSASRDELAGYWRWVGLTRTPPVEVLPLGADFAGTPRVLARMAPNTGRPQLLCVGILEPRKNQEFLIKVCERLWRDGLAFDLHIVGRSNPHFGAPIEAAIKRARRAFGSVIAWHRSADDRELGALYAAARATAFPTIAEGCGLPLLESLWLGVPCICSDLPVLRENAAAGGCLLVPVGNVDAWAAALRRVLTDEQELGRLSVEATTRPLPTWTNTARVLLESFTTPRPPTTAPHLHSASR